jgi:hypothetical protein
MPTLLIIGSLGKVLWINLYCEVLFLEYLPQDNAQMYKL